MNDIFLVRHGHAIAHAETDALRMLSGSGESEVKRLAELLRPHVADGTVIWHSPYLRATQTAQLLQAALGVRQLRSDDALTPDADPTDAANALRRATTPVVVVSHMPLLPALVMALAGRSPSFGTATALWLQVPPDGPAVVKSQFPHA